MKQYIKTISALTGTVAFTLHILNRIQCTTSTVKNILGCSKNNYYEWRFGKIRYIKKGNGTPLLLVHDLTVGSSCYEFSKIIDSLSKNYEIYCIDLLGYGLSDKPNMTYTNFLYVQLLTDFIKDIIGKKTNIIATGDSAPISIMVSHNNPETLNKIILINPQSIFRLNQNPSKQTKILKLLIEIPILGTFVYNMLTTKYSLTKTFRENYFFNPYKVKEEDITAYAESSHTYDCNSKYSFASYIGRYVNCNIVHALKEINNNIILIAGKERPDIETITDNYLYYNSSIETAYIPNTKQLPHMECPEKILSQLDIFLN